MSLQATVLRAVQTAIQAIDDLAVSASHISRTPTIYSPGGATVYDVKTYSVKAVITSYDQKEILVDRELASDAKILVFHEQVIPKLNDTLTVNGKQYRIMRSQPTYAGSEIAFSTVQARPL